MNFTIDRYLPDESATQRAATLLARGIVFPAIITFEGEIGAGKTTFIRALLQALGVKERIKSPTYAIVERYALNGQWIHHFDLYRIHDESELEYIGFNEYFSNDALCCIEWPQNAPNSIEHVDVCIRLSIKGEGRQLTCDALTATGNNLLSCLASQS